MEAASIKSSQTGPRCSKMDREQLMSRVLVVEDEQEIAELLVAYLERAGFDVVRASTVPDAIRIHGQFRPDLLLLDVALPGGGDGVEVLTSIRRRFDTPIIMVTALDDASVKLTSLRMGADDYVVKPFNPSEVVERVRAVLRRANGHSSRRTLQIGGLLIDLGTRMVFCSGGADEDGGIRLALTPTEFELLAHMARQPRRTFRRSELLHAVSPNSDAYDRVVDSHLSKLRVKLTAAGCPNMIEPVRGIGYRLWPGS